MKWMRVLGLCLVAALALCAAVASAAQAQTPEWGRCEKTKGGKYTEASCLTLAQEKTKKGQPTGEYKGKYEWHSLKEEEEKYKEPRCLGQKKGKYTESECKTVAEKKGKPDYKGSYEKYGPSFTGTGGTGVLNARFEDCYKNHEEEFVNERSAACDHINNGRENNSQAQYVECASEENAGRAIGVDQVEDVNITFKGCLYNGSVPCTNTGAEGEVKVAALKGHLGYIEKAASPPKVGILLEPETAGGRFVTFTCAGGFIEIAVGAGSAVEGMYYEGTGHDSIIAPVTPINTPTRTFEEVYKDNGEEAENEPAGFEGESGIIHRLETTLTVNEEEARLSQWARGGESITNLSSTEGLVEIRA